MTLHHDTGSEASGAAWMMAMLLAVVVSVALIVALFVWAPWDDNNAGTNTGPRDRTVPENQAPTFAPPAGTQQPIQSP